MATPETAVKQALNRKMEKLAKMCELTYKRLTFGPYSASGLPDRLEFFNVAGFACEVKRAGKKPTKLQEVKLQEMRDMGIPAIWVAGKEGEMGSDNVYHQLREQFNAEAVEKRIRKYREDCAILREALEELCDE